MATKTNGGVRASLRRLLSHARADGATDGRLLEGFLTRGEDAAFAALVRRHGPMVQGVCRRVLRDWHDAEDAFQATFLVLVRRAASIAPRDAVGPWLYGVAYRTALKARSASARRRLKERDARAAPPERNPSNGVGELRPVIDEELSRLPDRYRAAVVLCDLEGKSRREAAVCLRVAEGTLSSRLARARRLLARRLARRGVAPPALGMTAPVPPGMIQTTVQAATRFAAGKLAPGAAFARAAALAEGVYRTMTLAKWKMALMFLAFAAAFGLTAGAIVSPALAGKPAPDPAAKADKADKPAVGPSVAATVKALDADKHTLTAFTEQKAAVPGQKGGLEEKTFDLDKDVKVFLNDGLVKGQQKEGTPADVPPRWGVDLQLSVDGKTVVAITVHPRGMSGSVRSADPSSNTVTITTKEKGGQVEEKTLTLHKDGKILLSDGLNKSDPPVEGKFADLTEGTPVAFELSPAKKDTITGIRVLGHTVVGSLKGVDAGTRTVIVTTKEDGSVVDKSYTLLKDARIEVTSGNSTQAGTLADLKDGDSVAVTLSVVEKEKAAYVRANRDR